jgi:hypothetical protein
MRQAGLIATLVLFLFPRPVLADARLNILFDALRIPEVIDIMREEGFSYSEDLNRDFLSAQGGPFWSVQIDRIYDAQRMRETVRQALEEGVTADNRDAAIRFFVSETGTTVVSLENAARRAMAEDAVEEAARARHAELADSDDPRFALVSAFVAANDLLDRNLSGAMSSNYQFYRGLVDGRLLALSEAEILDEVWGQEEEIRADTESWLFGYLLLAYQPLTQTDLEAYLAFSESAAGKALNAALFEGYETMYREISYALGRAIALSVSGNDI